MKVAVDARPFQGKLTGVGKYVLYLLQQIEQKHPDVEFLFITNREIIDTLPLANYRVIMSSKLFGKLKPMIWYILFSHFLLRKEKIDLFFAGASFSPFFLRNIKITTVIHDLNHILASETMSSLHLITHILFFKKALTSSHRIITNSEGTAQKLEKYYGVIVNEIINPFVDPVLYKVLDAELVQQRLVKYNLKGVSYLLSVGTLEPRKNIDKLVKAFLSLLSDGYLTDYKLVLVGGNGWKNNEIQKLISDNSETIYQLGYVNEEDLPILYNGAKLFIFPSKYEGFGIPPREAIYCGTKCVVSDIIELREATFNQSSYISDVNDLDLIKKMVLADVVKTDKHQ